MVLAFELANMLGPACPCILLAPGSTKVDHDAAVADLTGSREHALVLWDAKCDRLGFLALTLHLWNHRQHKWYDCSQRAIDPAVDYTLKEYGYPLTSHVYWSGSAMLPWGDLVHGRIATLMSNLPVPYTNVNHECTGRRPDVRCRKTIP